MLKHLNTYQSQIDKNKNMNSKAFKESLKDFFKSLDKDLSLVDLENSDLLILKNKTRYLASIDAKNFDCDLSNLNHKSLSLIKENNNHIITNFRELDVYKKGQLLYTLSLLDEKGKVSDKSTLIPISLYTGDQAIQMLEKTVQEFEVEPLICNKPSDLAIVLALKTKVLKDIIYSCLSSEKKDRELTKLEQEFETYKNLMPDLNISRFSDYYAQTITYGLFIVRYLNSVSKIESSFLEEAFSIISSKNIDPRINKIYGEIQTILLQIDLNSDAWISSTNDITIHFYQTFLEHYDSKLRKDFGAWFTPKYLVEYQVKATNVLLKYIGYDKGFADDINILDPSMGTCNYLNTIIKEVYSEYEHNNALWNTLVNSKLISSFYGFEILMTSFIIAQMKLVETLRNTGFDFNANTPPLNLFLTNTLDPPKKDNSGFEYSDYLYEINNMSKKVLDLKNKKFACIISNPPYNGQSIHRSNYINELMLEYKPSNRIIGDALNDDYLKFIRIAQNFIKQNGKGVVSYVTNNTFLKNISYDKLRESLLRDFDEIYIINLHGDQKNDENIFDIPLGVALFFLVRKSNTKNKFADVFYQEVLGTKEDKKEFCLSHVFNPNTKNGFQHLSFKNDKTFLFIPKQESSSRYFNNSFSLDDLFITKAYGIKTGNNDLYVKSNSNFNIDEKGIALEYSYGPFDNQYIYWCDSLQSKSKKVTNLKTPSNNFYLVFTSSVRDLHDFSHVFVSKQYCDATFFYGKANPYFAPVFLDKNNHNLNDACFTIFKKLDPKISPVDVIDYVYGVLNEQQYLKEFNQLLKLNIPRVFYPVSKEQLQHFIKIGASLRNIHLTLKPTQHSVLKDVFFDIAQDKTTVSISKVSFDRDRIRINDTQYFLAKRSIWEYKVGASHPAKDWLENRIGQTLSFQEIETYINILGVIKETLSITQSNLLLLDDLNAQENTLF
jgi:predicted helicase